MLSELVDNKLTDKNTDHSYLDLYHSLVCSKKETAKKAEILKTITALFDMLTVWSR